jgi:hypothetical protein
MTELESRTEGTDDSTLRRIQKKIQRFDLAGLNRKYGPWIALGSGLLTLLFWRRGASFAPMAVASLIFAWTATVAATRFLAEREGEAKWRRVARAIASTLIVGLYQDALFYLLPLWFESATFVSLNLAFPTLLAAMAVFSCFEHLYTEYVQDRPMVREMWSAIVLFATITAAVPVSIDLSPRMSLAVAAAFSALIAALTLSPVERLKPPKGPLLLAGTALGAAILAAVLAPILPPVPLHTSASKTGTGVEEREIVGAASDFPAGVPKIYAWFAVNAPPGYKQAVRFEWYRDGELVGKPFTTTVTGGRKAGFRTWGHITAPKSGSWKIELYTDGGQLLDRISFDVE